MLKIVRYLAFMTCFLMQACHHAANQEAVQAKVDLNKAAEYNMQLGLGYLKQGDRPRAKMKLLTALEQAPKKSEVNSAIAYYFEQTNELAQAEDYYLKAVSLSGNSGAELNNYGAFLCRHNQYPKAELYFLKAVADQQYIHTAGAYENAGLCSLAIQDYTKAKRYFSKALDQDPLRRESLYELVLLENKLGNYTKALKLLENHPQLVLNDRIFLALAKKLAYKAGNGTLAANYENNFRNMESNTVNSGANNEYNNHNG